jgi:hypothetical protein
MIETQDTLANTLRKSFPTLQACYEWANGQVNLGCREKLWTVNVSRLYNDLFKCARPRGLTGRYVKLLGISPKAEKEFKKIEPHGEWRLEVDPPNTSYERAGIFGNTVQRTSGFTISVWYSRFLPYAYAMMMCENGFEVMGADYQFINVWYTSCYGFVDLGNGDGCMTDGTYYRIDNSDCESFNRIYNASMKVRSPSLPFDEAFNPCCCYVAIHAPKLFGKSISDDHWVRGHVHDVCEEMNIKCLIRRGS